MKTILIHTSGGHDLELEIAGAGSRSYAFIIDWHVRLLLTLAWLSLFWLLSDLRVFEFFRSLNNEALWSVYLVLIPAAVIYFFYHPVLEILMRGSTPGKRMAGVRIVSLDGRVPSAGALLVRNIFRLLDSMPVFYVVGLVATFFTHNEVRIGDLAAGTVLVYERNIGNSEIDRTASILINGRLSPDDSEQVLEMLERWQGLSREIRRRLAVELLTRHNETFANDESDSGLRQRLTSLLGH